MKIYVFNTYETYLLTCFSQEKIILNDTYGITTEDRILFIVNDKVSGIARLLKRIEKEEQIHFTLQMEQFFLEENRIFLHQLPFDTTLIPTSYDFIEHFPIENNDSLLFYLHSLDDDMGFLFSNIDSLLEVANEQQTIETKKQLKEEEYSSFKTIDTADLNEHQKAQFYLNEIGSICNLETWTASNDKNRTYKGRKLGITDIEDFPLFHMSDKTQQRTELIDTIWLQNNRPVCAFEVETTTTIYSGLLRLADMATVLSTSHLDLYIVAPKKRIKKFIHEIQRPLFQSINLPEKCHFISIESLEILYQKVKGLNGYVDYGVLNVIRQSANQLEKVHL